MSFSPWLPETLRVLPGAFLQVSISVSVFECVSLFVRLCASLRPSHRRFLFSFSLCTSTHPLLQSLFPFLTLLPTSVIPCYGHNLVLEPCHQVQASHSQITLTFPTFFLYDSFNSKGISVQFSRSAVSDSFRPHGLQQARLSCPSPTPGVYSNSSSQ